MPGTAQSPVPPPHSHAARCASTLPPHSHAARCASTLQRVAVDTFGLASTSLHLVDARTYPVMAGCGPRCLGVLSARNNGMLFIELPALPEDERWAPSTEWAIAQIAHQIAHVAEGDAHGLGFARVLERLLIQARSGGFVSSSNPVLSAPVHSSTYLPSSHAPGTMDASAPTAGAYGTHAHAQRGPRYHDGPARGSAKGSAKGTAQFSHPGGFSNSARGGGNTRSAGVDAGYSNYGRGRGHHSGGGYHYGTYPSS